MHERTGTKPKARLFATVHYVSCTYLTELLLRATPLLSQARIFAPLHAGRSYPGKSRFSHSDERELYSRVLLMLQSAYLVENVLSKPNYIRYVNISSCGSLIVSSDIIYTHL